MKDDSRITMKIGASAFTTYVSSVLAAGAGIACAVGVIVFVRSDAPTNWGIVALLASAASILGFGAVG